MDPNRKRIFVISAVIIMLVLVVANSIFRSQSRRIEGLKAKVAEEREKNRLLIEIGEMVEEIDSYQPRIPLERDVDWLRMEVIRMANESGVKIISITPRSPEKRHLYTRLAVEMEVECGYHQLGEFVSKLESSKRFIKIDSLNLEAGGATGAERIAKASITVSTFYLKEGFKRRVKGLGEWMEPR